MLKKTFLLCIVSGLIFSNLINPTTIQAKERNKSFNVPQLNPLNEQEINSYLNGINSLFSNYQFTSFIDGMIKKEEEQRKKIEEELKKAEEEAKRKAEEERRKAEEAKRKAEEEAKRKAEEERLKKEQEQLENSGFVNKSGYQKLRRYSSNVHIYVTKSNETASVSLGSKNKRQAVSNIHLSGETAKVNLGFFSFSGAPLHLGTYISNGEYIYTPSSRYMDFILYKDGRTEIKNLTSLTEEQKEYYKSNARFVVGTSYSLMQNGSINLQNSSMFSHATSRHPRTLFCSRTNGSLALVVVDGRSRSSAGVTAKQSAQIMKEIGCYNAVNFDGGGSSTMVLNGRVKNKPSDGSQRRVGSVLIVVPK